MEVLGTILAIALMIFFPLMLVVFVVTTLWSEYKQRGFVVAFSDLLLAIGLNLLEIAIVRHFYQPYKYDFVGSIFTTHVVYYWLIPKILKGRTIGEKILRFFRW